jgi:cellulose synthase operon protein B
MWTRAPQGCLASTTRWSQIGRCRFWEESNLMKKLLYALVVASLLVVLYGGWVSPSLAQGPEPRPGDTESQAEASSIPFSRLGFTEQIMQAPFGSAHFEFSLPATWELAPGAEVQLALTSYVAATSGSSGQQGAGCLLRVSLNNVALGSTILLEPGTQALTFPLTGEAMAASRDPFQHQLRAALNGGPGCDAAQQAGVLVQSDSRLVLPHRVVTPPLDLRLMPRPLYQGALVENEATIVVPDVPTAQELETALTIAVGFGRLTGGQLGLSLTTPTRLTDEARENQHLIFVGRAGSFPEPVGVPLPTVVDGALAGIAGAARGDGLVQLALSPWNESRVVLIATGADDASLKKAGQAIASDTMMIGAQPDVALVADIREEPVTAAIPVDRRFSELGYRARTLSGLSGEVAEYEFAVPPGQTVGADAYLGLVFNHSLRLSYEQSELLVTLNDTRIGSVRFTDASARRGEERLIIPGSALRPGKNRLVIAANLKPAVGVVDVQPGDLWLSLWPESLLHLPLAPLPGAGTRQLNLAGYTDIFVQSLAMSELGFVVARDDPVSWNVAARIAADLGRLTAGSTAAPALYYDDELVGQSSSGDLLVVGQPNRLLVIHELADALPAQFEEGSNIPAEFGSNVVYRITPETDVGYLELLAPPSNPTHVVLAVLGSTETGVEWAGAALTAPHLRDQLRGDFAIISGEQIIASEASATRAPTAGAAPLTTSQAAPPGMAGAQRPAWVLPVLTMALLLMMAILGRVIISTVRRGSSSRQGSR